MSEKTDLPCPHPHPALLASVIDQLACPVCFAGLEMRENRLICKDRGHVYPIVNGIPVLIAGHSETSSSE